MIPTQLTASDSAMQQQQSSQTAPPAQHQPHQVVDLTKNHVRPVAFTDPPPAAIPVPATDSIKMLEQRLLARHTEQMCGIILALAQHDPRTHDMIKRMMQNYEQEDAEAARKAEEQRREAEETKMRMPLNFEALIQKVKIYVYDERPCWTRSQQMTEALRVSAGIEEIFQQMIDRCGPTTPTEIKYKTFIVMLEMLDIIIDTEESHTNRHCKNETSDLWESAVLRMWSCLNIEEKVTTARSPELKAQLLDVDKKWMEYGVCHMFTKVALAMRSVVRGATADLRSDAALYAQDVSALGRGNPEEDMTLAEILDYEVTSPRSSRKCCHEPTPTVVVIDDVLVETLSGSSTVSIAFP